MTDTEVTYFCVGHGMDLPASAFDKPGPLAKKCRDCKKAAYEDKKRKVKERAARLKNQPAVEGKKRCPHCFREMDLSEFTNVETGDTFVHCAKCRASRAAADRRLYARQTGHA